MAKTRRQLVSMIKEIWGAEDENIVLPYIFTDWEWTDNDMYGGPEGKYWYRMRFFGLKEDGGITPIWVTEILRDKIKREHWKAGATSMDNYLELLDINKKNCEKKGLTVYKV